MSLLLSLFRVFIRRRYSEMDSRGLTLPDRNTVIVPGEIGENWRAVVQPGRTVASYANGRGFKSLLRNQKLTVSGR